MNHLANTDPLPKYPIPFSLLPAVLWSRIRSRRRSFHRDAQKLIAGRNPPVDLCGAEHIPPMGPCLVTMNHYVRPNFGVWWNALAISAAFPTEIAWVVARGWQYPRRIEQLTIQPAVALGIRWLSEVYGFFRMPPMPPNPHESAERADAVRRIVHYVRSNPHSVLGLAPEGYDIPGGRLGWPPAGVGRFIALLARSGLPILPVGAFEVDGVLTIRFGALYQLDLAEGQSAHDLDRRAAQGVMQAIAALVPANFWGDFEPVKGEPIDQTSTAQTSIAE